MSGESTRERAQAMLRQLLADRFGLRTRREQREMPVYVLTLARRDGSLGPKLRRAGQECLPMTPTAVDGVAPPPPPPPPPPPGGNPTRPLLERVVQVRCPSMFFPGGASARAIPMEELAWGLTRFLARPVIDRTGLNGEFNVDLSYQYELAATGPGAAASGPSVFTAVEEQLGLKLESTRAPFEVVVIEGVAQPSEN